MPARNLLTALGQGQPQRPAVPSFDAGDDAAKKAAMQKMLRQNAPKLQALKAQGVDVDALLAQMTSQMDAVDQELRAKGQGPGQSQAAAGVDTGPKRLRDLMAKGNGPTSPGEPSLGDLQAQGLVPRELFNVPSQPEGRPLIRPEANIFPQGIDLLKAQQRAAFLEKPLPVRKQHVSEEERASNQAARGQDSLAQKPQEVQPPKPQGRAFSMASSLPEQLSVPGEPPAATKPPSILDRSKLPTSMAEGLQAPTPEEAATLPSLVRVRSPFSGGGGFPLAFGEVGKKDTEKGSAALDAKSDAGLERLPVPTPTQVQKTRTVVDPEAIESAAEDFAVGANTIPEAKANMDARFMGDPEMESFYRDALAAVEARLSKLQEPPSVLEYIAQVLVVLAAGFIGSDPFAVAEIVTGQGRKESERGQLQDQLMELKMGKLQTRARGRERAQDRQLKREDIQARTASDFAGIAARDRDSEADRQQAAQIALLRELGRAAGQEAGIVGGMNSAQADTAVKRMLGLRDAAGLNPETIRQQAQLMQLLADQAALEEEENALRQPKVRKLLNRP